MYQTEPKHPAGLVVLLENKIYHAIKRGCQVSQSIQKRDERLEWIC